MFKRNNSLLVALIVSAGLIGASVLAADVVVDRSESDAVAAPVEPSASVTLDPSEVGEFGVALNGVFTALADAVTPSVVRIEVRKEGREMDAQMPRFELPEPFERFFDLPDLERRGPQQPMPRITGGSGFLISDDGYIVTNDHVVSDADEITVWLENRHSYEAEVIGSDPTTDVAVIRIEGEDFPALEWGSSAELRVGEWVVAVGNPGVGNNRPLDYTVTAGIVSAKDRPLQLIGQSLQRDPDFEELAGYAIENFIQTDAVINPGNSGGPLLDVFGRVVGINTAIASTSGYYQGYGFAVPADLAMRVVEDLIEDGSVERAWLGVMVTGITPEDAELYGLPTVSGALIQNVTDESPAADAGLQREDVIVGIDGSPVDRGGSLQQLVAQHRPGEEVTVSVYRDGEPREVEVELGQVPMREGASRAEAPTRRTASVDHLGIDVETLTPQLARELGYEEARGVVVDDVDPTGPAARRGVAPGLRILEVDDRTIDSVESLEQALEDVDEGDIVGLLLETPDGQTRIANVRAR